MMMECGVSGGRVKVMMVFGVADLGGRGDVEGQNGVKVGGFYLPGFNKKGWVLGCYGDGPRRGVVGWIIIWIESSSKRGGPFVN